MSIVGGGADQEAVADLGQLGAAFEAVANTDLKDVLAGHSLVIVPIRGFSERNVNGTFFLCITARVAGWLRGWFTVLDPKDKIGSGIT